MVCLMQAADEAEARGDAAAALAIIESRPLDADGSQFWRHERVCRLHQAIILRQLWPRWATSRWILAQAMQMMEPSRRPFHQKALEIAVDLRGGRGTLPGRDDVDRRARIQDHDWVYRQLVLYEYGGLATFLRRVAAPDLVVGADRIHDWARAPMRVLRLTGRSARTLHWRDLATGQDVEVLDLGAAAMVLTQECVLGRLVPTEEGELFESIPLRIPEDVAAEVALDPAGWLEALRRGARVERPAEERLETSILRGVNPLTDVPSMVWQCAALDYAEIDDGSAVTVEIVAEAAIAVVRGLLTGRLQVGDEDLDPWACVGAALVDPIVLYQLDGAFTVEDAPALLVLAERLVGPAGEVCRELAASARDAA